MHIKDVVFVYQMHEPQELKWHGRTHNHDSNEYEVHYFLQGVGSFLNNKKQYSITPGTLFLTSPFERHAILVDDLSNPLTYYAVLFEISNEDQDIFQLLEDEMNKERSYSIGSNYRFFFEELKERSMSSRTYLNKSANHQFISFLYLIAEKKQVFHYGDETNQHIERSLRIMQNNIFSDMQLKQITDKLSLTESYFIRLFRRKMNTTPMKYFTKLKIEAATSMLMSSNQPIYQIADKLNFYSEFHFSRVFKQYTGNPPSVYRDRYRQELGD